MTVPPEHAALDSVAAPIMVVLDNAVVHANPACVALLSRSLEELKSKSVMDHIEGAVAPDDAGMIRSFTVSRLQGGSPPGAYYVRVRTGDGRSLALEVLSLPGPRPGEKTHVFRDAGPDESARRLSDALAAASWQLVPLRDEQAVIEAAADALSIEGFRVIFLQLFGDELVHVALRQDPAAQAELKSVSGKPMRQMPLHKSAVPDFMRLFESRRAAFDQDTHALVDRIRPPDQAAIIKAAMPRRAVNAPVFVEGEPFGMLSAQHESLTPAGVGAIELFAHRLGAALDNVRHHQRAAQQLEELKRLQDKLLAQERVATLGEAAAVLSHEVRNPVAAILNAMAVLRRAPVHDAEVVRMAEEEALRLDRLVHDLLHLARPLTPKSTELDLRVVAERSVQRLRDRIAQAQVEVRVESPQRVPTLGDAFLLGLAVENLLANALRVSPPRGRVQLSLEQQPGCARLAIDDQGPGVAPELAERIFEPFFTTSAAGTGLGLAVVRKVVEAHRGTVRALARGAFGGARFELELPAP